MLPNVESSQTEHLFGTHTLSAHSVMCLSIYSRCNSVSLISKLSTAIYYPFVMLIVLASTMIRLIRSGLDKDLRSDQRNDL